MKKLFLIVGIAGFMAACTDTTSDATTNTDTVTPAPMETPATTTVDTTATTTSAAMKDGVMTLKDGKVMVMTGGAWVELKAAVTTTNGRKVSPNGEVSKGDKKRKLEEGQMIDKDGQMMDKDGKMLDNSGWE
jgi:hypothetical protein